MTDRINQLNDRARWFLESFDEIDLAEICANEEAAKDQARAAITRVRKLLADDPSGIFSDDEIRAALNEPKEG